ncbi:hypothetical protein, partial [Bradyrhizobium diazoefficiens]|uniref:hypothetical protein n=1 Tax=Bradyrhizobium diazoefficiens TaxID=1355477 RepID=UPI001B8D888F
MSNSLHPNAASSSPDGTAMPAQKESGGAEAPPPDLACDVCRLLAEQLQHALLRLVGQRQRGDRDRLAGRQRL